ncbi:pentatricopeptide repeat-containing protein At2g40720 isoform X2 [Malania oleifera]|uniref:pentatricopeptide repeat-containing protein At2g40720 isoform X2 n=1 Tax=Malania oleifera TaxID=397392 RepID=UPI0025AE7482|nr:pentatricopeptide repeat-containing protein At2g40720 isoform X2 [Malania oleifera]
MRLNKFSLCRKLSYLRQSHQSPLSITSKHRTFVQQGLYSEALQPYFTKPISHHAAAVTGKFVFPSLLKACAALSDLRHGQILHSAIVTMGLHSDPYIAVSLINMYAKCGSLASAVEVFAEMSESQVAVQDVTLWNSMIDGYFRYGQVHEGIILFSRMQSLGVRPDAYSLSILLGTCEGMSVAGKQIHAYIVRNMLYGDPFLETALIDMYSSCGRPVDASRVFDKWADKNNVVAWNALISGLCENGLWENSLELFALAKSESCTLGSASFSSALTACCYGEDVDFGRQVHCDAIKAGFEIDSYVCTSLLTMYAKCGLVELAEEVFDRTTIKETELWNAMISAYVVHAELIKRPAQSSIAAQSGLLTMYSKCGSVEDAILIFTTMKERDLVAWGSMISGFCQNRKFMEALDLFRAMEVDGIKLDPDIMASVISACMGLENIKLGCGIHGYVIKIGLGSDVFVASSLVDMYSKCGFAEMARKVFSGMSQKNLVAWNSIISCHCRNGCPELALMLFPQIVQHGLCPDSISVTIVLAAVSSLAALLKGKIVHGYQIRLQIPSDLQVENALIDMYIKCGSLKYAQNIFWDMPRKNLATWNSMIAGYGCHGECLIAIRLFNDMKRSGIAPDDITFLSLISSCSHSGLIEEGLNLFQSMRGEYGIEPKAEHYANVVDLLSRAGCLDDAYHFIQNLPIEPNRSVWLCLLCACRVHRNIELGELAAQNLLRMEPAGGSDYVHLLNLYGEAESWDKAATLRVSMKEEGLKKKPGCSWIEVGNRVDMFFSGDSSSPRTFEIYETLNTLRRNMEGKRRLLDGVWKK